MALTKEQWASKIRTFFPQWFFEVEQNNIAFINGLSAALSATQVLMEENFNKTFIGNASDSLLELHGSERTVVRTTGESDSLYRERIRSLLNLSTQNELFNALKSCLSNGDPLLIENHNYGYFGFVDNELYFDDQKSIWLSHHKFWNWFTVIIPAQEFGNEALIKEAVIKVLEECKALGVTYDVEYRT